MRRMLVDDGDAVTCLGNDIGLVKLRARRAEKRIRNRLTGDLGRRRADGGRSGIIDGSGRGACQSRGGAA